jgi:hypothetical protein
VSEIPNAGDARVVELGEIASIRSGVAHRSSRPLSEMVGIDGLEDPQYLLTSRALSSARGIHLDELVALDEPVGEQHELRDGDILFANRDSGYFAWVFRSEIVEHRKCVAGNQFLRIQLNESAGVVPGYVAWYLNHPVARSEYRNLSAGTTISTISGKRFAKFVVPCPSALAQGSIVDADAAFREWNDMHQEVLQSTRNWVDRFTLEASGYQLVRGEVDEG